MGIALRYIQASQSSNLRSDEHHHHTDTLAAVALSNREFGSLLMRVKYASDAGSYHKLKEAWREYVVRKAAQYGWKIHVNREIVADVVLDYWLMDLCRPCGGKGHLELQPRVLSDDDCPHCNGSGKRKMEIDGRFKRYALDMLTVIDGLVERAGSNAMAKLASDMDSIR